MPSPRNFLEVLTDPAAAAERGRWLARGAWLLAAAEVVMAVKNHVTDRLTPRERGRILEIVRSSKGRPSNLSNRERNELQALLAKVEPRELAKKVTTSGLASRFTPGRRHKH
jgi:tellurite resistance protein